MPLGPSPTNADDRANADRVDKEIANAAEHAKVLVRGGRITDCPLATGTFIRPSLIEVDDVDRPLIQQEIFGPVATVDAFDDEADAIARANATAFGLAASLWTRNVDRPLRGRPRTQGGHRLGQPESE